MGLMIVSLVLLTVGLALAVWAFIHGNGQAAGSDGADAPATSRDDVEADQETDGNKSASGRSMLDPSNPIGLTSPISPLNPASPLNPLNPLNPSNPANPASPLNPSNPASPFNPF